MVPSLSRRAVLGSLAACLAATATAADNVDGRPQASDTKVSYSKHVVPILQAHCIGCHQPAKAQGGYDMTTFAKLTTAGDKGNAPIVPKKPLESELVSQVAVKDGKHEMPKNKPPIPKADFETVTRWIAEGAENDAPTAGPAYSADHPPTYPLPPVVTAIDVSPDAALIAVAGYHEVLLHKADGSGIAGRLIGLSERVESVRFSPDGKTLAVACGDPCKRGEIQLWDAAKAKLKSSIPVGYDVVRGVSWSPDGRFVAVACPDNNVRAFDVSNGTQTLAQGSHSDWPLDTVYSVDGSHLVSVGRDRTAKLTEVATQRFVDNITSITPGALKGGIGGVARHPQRDEIVVGGADGIPRVYRMHRQTKRVIGDDSNLIRELPAMFGRINAVAVSRDGKRIVAGSGLDAAGEVAVYGYEFKTDLPGPLKNIMEKVASSRNAEEKKQLADYLNDGVKRFSKVRLPAGVYSVAFRPDGQAFYAAGSDGIVRAFETDTGKPLGEFSAASVTAKAGREKVAATATPTWLSGAVEAEALPAGASVVKLAVQPAKVSITDPFGYAQLLVSATLNTGDVVDATRMAQMTATGDAVRVSKAGVVQPTRDGAATVRVSLGGQSIDVPATVGGLESDYHADYVRDVMPALSRMGCNQGTCHGSAQGKNGFKLSLRGYDPIFDVRAFTDEHASRRVTVAAPDRSLMLLKATNAVPHVGGQVTRPGEPYYEVLKSWIGNGAKLDLASPKVTAIEVLPKNPIVQALNAKQQLRVVATYASGATRDVTHEAFLESGNSDVATVGRTGLITALRRGEAPVLARFEGAYAATTLTVMGDRTGFVWEQPLAYNRIDELTAAKWQRMKIKPSDVCTDAEFVRRVSLDLTGLPPSADDVRAFLADSTPSRQKRDALVDKLIGSPAFVEYWTNKWADLLQVNRKFLGAEGAAAFRAWIRAEVANNTPYDQFARKVLTATGSNKDNPAASYFKILREPTATMENTTHLFLAVRFNCNKCHDHPFERWTQDQYYQTSAYFAQVALKGDPASAGKLIGGTAVEGGKPMYEIVSDVPKGEVLHDRTKEETAPQFPFACNHDDAASNNRRQKLANWISSKDNPLFAKSYANRLWGYLFGVGVIEPIDDIRAGNPASNPDLLDYLTDEFVKGGFDLRKQLTLMCKSRTYQLSVVANQWNADDKTNASHAVARRLPAEVLYDSIQKVAGSVSKIPGVKAGMRAAELPDVGIELPGGFLGTLGRPVRESACECERTSGLQLGPVMALVNGPTIADALADKDNELTKLVAGTADDRALVKELFLRILNRAATEAEVDASVAVIGSIEAEHAKLTATVDARAKEVAPIKAKAEEERQAAFTKVMTELAAYEKEIGPKLKQMEADRLAAIAAADKAVADGEKALPGKVAALEKMARDLPTWQPLLPTSVKSSSGSKLTVMDDRSVFASGKDGKTNVTFVAPTDLQRITAFRLEVLADDRLPKHGPGRAENGNFVLNQFEVRAAPKGNPKALEKVDLRDVTASFTQSMFRLKDIIDGSPNGTKGWAIMGATGRTQWAVFDVKEPFGHKDGSVLTVTLPQNFEGNHQIGRFRVSVTTATGKIPLGVPDAVQAALAVPAEERDAKQTDVIVSHLRFTDAEFTKLTKTLAEAKKPLPVDPKLKELQDTVAQLRKPLPEDEKLMQLKTDAAASQSQLENRRLTGAQDIAWALINSPAFLFNR